MRVLMWHVHGSWATSFVQGDHDVILPTTPDRGPEGRGRADTWDWPERAREVAARDLHDEPLDVVVLQRPEEVELCERWTGRRPGRDLPAVYVEHNTPRGDPVATRHPVADDERLSDVPIVHVTHFNAVMWDNGKQPVIVVEHGVPDPGHLYDGSDASIAAVVNEPVRRLRVVGTDLLLELARDVPVHVYGMGMSALSELAGDEGLPDLADRLHEDVPQHRLHTELARHRAYLHPFRWTSLGLSLIEAMLLGLPVLVLATTEAPVAVPPEAGLVSSDLTRLREQAQRWLARPDEARERGAAARRHALDQYGLPRFLADWDAVLGEVAR
jgi:hypothetical protein